MLASVTSNLSHVPFYNAISRAWMCGVAAEESWRRRSAVWAALGALVGDKLKSKGERRR